MPRPRRACTSRLSGPLVSGRASPKINEAHGGETSVSPIGRNPGRNGVSSMSAYFEEMTVFANRGVLGLHEVRPATRCP